MSTNQPDRNLFLLAKKWLAGRITDQEKSEFDQWYNAFDDTQHQLLSDETAAEMESRIQQSIFSQAGLVQKKSVKLWPGLAFTAAAVAAIVFGVWFYHTHDMNGIHPELVSGSKFKSDIAPGKNTATLTLANGKTITLSDAKTGVVIDQNSLKYNDGTTLSGLQPSLPEGERMLTASTPRGGTYQFTLPDGTQVWLNAASTLKFPSQFSGTNRKILLKGEAYFEVAKDKAHPFIVTTKDQEVEVLGTHFNINSYQDEASVKTTLLEGSVKVQTSANQNAILKPGEQAQASAAGKIQVQAIDTELAIAWKNNNFIFENDDIQYITRMLERWYNVEVVYQGPAPTKKFGGAVSRFDNISSVLKILEMTGGAHFKIEGRTVYVTQ